MKKSAIKWLYTVTGKHRKCICLLLALQALLGASGVAFALLLRGVIDNAAAKDLKGFLTFLALLAGLILAEILLSAAIRLLGEHSRSSVENAFKSRLFGCLLRKDYASVTHLHSGEWLTRLTSDAVICANDVVNFVPDLVEMLVGMLGALAMMFALEPRFAYIFFPAGVILLALTYSFRKIMKRLHKNVQESDGKLRVFLQERLGSMLIVRSFAAEGQIEEQAAEKMAAHKAARMKKTRFSVFCNTGFSCAMDSLYLLGLAYGGYGIVRGTISYGTLTAILQLIGQIQRPFAGITGFLPRFYAMAASAERLMEAESYPDDCPKGAFPAGRIQSFYENEFSSIAFENVSFSYGGSDPVSVLDHVNLTIRKGEFAAFTGQSGCGKSTLLKLLMCLYSLDEGACFLVKTSGEKEPLTSRWHRLFAYVPQGNHLMSGAVREVIAFSDKSQMHDEEKLRRALKIACADEFVSGLENGLDTVLGERGAGLSEGQMQRIAIARAVFSDHPILLLDESTSALDEQTERRLLENLRSMTEKTVLIVTHRPAALQICDKFFGMTENGIEEIQP